MTGLPLRNKEQKIVVGCIVTHTEYVLLLRGSEFLDRASAEATSYFSIPRFTLGFGEEPESYVRTQLARHFAQELDGLAVCSVTAKLTADGVHVLEVLYHAQVPTMSDARPGRFCFVHRDELAGYMFPTELAYIQRFV